MRKNKCPLLSFLSACLFVLFGLCFFPSDVSAASRTNLYQSNIKSIDFGTTGGTIYGKELNNAYGLITFQPSAQYSLFRFYDMSLNFSGNDHFPIPFSVKEGQKFNIRVSFAVANATSPPTCPVTSSDLVTSQYDYAVAVIDDCELSFASQIDGLFLPVSGAVASADNSFNFTYNITGHFRTNAKISRLAFEGTWLSGSSDNQRFIQVYYTSSKVAIYDELPSSEQLTIEENGKQAHEDAEAQREATEAQTKQQQDQYEQDKQEEADRENSANDDANKLAGAFSFTFLNPFVGIFELFNPSGCVSIPTIANMVGSDSSQYCPWFSNSTRNVLTPVVGLAGSMLLFGFVIRGFLNKGNFSGGIEV